MRKEPCCHTKNSAKMDKKARIGYFDGIGNANVLKTPQTQEAKKDSDVTIA